LNEWECKFQKGSEEWMFFQDMYKTLQSFWNIENVTNEEWKDYWNCLRESVNHLRTKYNCALANNFTDAILKTMVDKSVGKEHECKMVFDFRWLEDEN